MIIGLLKDPSNGNTRNKERARICVGAGGMPGPDGSESEWHLRLRGKPWLLMLDLMEPWSLLGLALMVLPPAGLS